MNREPSRFTPTGFTRSRTSVGQYWTGNAAKSKIVGELIADAAGRALRVFDYGCGNGGDWPAILLDHPHIKLIGYEPDHLRAREAERRLTGTDAQVFTGPSPPELDPPVDRMVSLSVFEHVLDRKAYLEAAHRRLSCEGRFYLNYDDGHFRIAFDLDEKTAWLAQLRVAAHNFVAKPLARLGLPDGFQARVQREDVDRLVAATGFRVLDAYYSNLIAFKELAATLPDERRDEFASFWIEVERRLNSEFASSVASLRGDQCNLWRWMATRTLVLAHA